jgi:hypothetical protein
MADNDPNTRHAANLDDAPEADHQRANQGAEQLRREARHEGEGERRRDVADEDTGVDGLLRKGVGGSSNDVDRALERKAPDALSDNGDR